MEIEDEEEQESVLEAKKSYLKQTLCRKFQDIIKKCLVYADMAWGTDFQIQLLQDSGRTLKSQHQPGGFQENN